MQLKLLSAALTCLIGAVAVTQLTGSLAQEIDRVTGLIMQDGWQDVQANCTECHSARLITQSSGSREVWKSRIVWMQQTQQGLHELEIEVENSILDYLAANYAQKAASRRPGLTAQLLPVNPYPTDN